MEAKPSSRAACAPGQKGGRQKDKRGWLRESSLWITRSPCCRHFSPLNDGGLGGAPQHGVTGNDHRRIVRRWSLRISYRRRSVALPIHSSSISSDEAGALAGTLN